MADLRRIAPALAGLAGLAGLTAATLDTGEPDAAPWRSFGLTGLLWAAFAIGCWLLRQVPINSAVRLIVAGGIVLQAVAISVPPRTTDDFYRYAWDGRVQATGVDPYRYPPTAPELSGLRDDWLFPGGEPRLNRSSEPTIYPPGAQAYFLTVHELSPAGSRHKPWQIAAALLAVATSVLLIAALHRNGGDPRLAVLWAWCPTVVLEAGNNGHVDVLAALLVVAGLAALSSATHPARRPTAAGRGDRGQAAARSGPRRDAAAPLRPGSGRCRGGVRHSLPAARPGRRHRCAGLPARLPRPGGVRRKRAVRTRAAASAAVAGALRCRSGVDRGGRNQLAADGSRSAVERSAAGHGRGVSAAHPQLPVVRAATGRTGGIGRAMGVAGGGRRRLCGLLRRTDRRHPRDHAGDRLRAGPGCRGGENRGGDFRGS